MNQTEKELEIIRSNNIDKYCPQGYLFCYDKKGNLLFHNHNMIVKSGRKLIFDELLRNSGTPKNILKSLKAKLGDSTSLVSESDVANSLGKTTDLIEQDTSSSDDTDNLIYTFIFKYTAGSIDKITTLGLFFEENEENTLFSRVVFPEYPGNADLTFTYYIYF